MEGNELLKITNLKLTFNDVAAPTVIVDGVSFSVNEGEIVGLIGESGSGKTQIALCLAGLLQLRGDIAMQGSIAFDGFEILKRRDKNTPDIFGKDIGIVFQEPQSALNPLVKIGKQAEEGLILHTDYDKKRRKEIVLESFAKLGLNEPEKLYDSYPHRLSGGMRQRVMLSVATICSPKLLVADEPTTSLDLGLQKRIIDLLKDLNSKNNMAVIFVSHDLRLVKGFCDRVIVMKDGRIVETGMTEEIFKNPREAYTRQLLK